MTQPGEDVKAQRLRRFLMATVDERLDDAARELAPSATYRVAGPGPLAGTFRGPRAVIDHLRRARHTLTASIDPLEWVDWMEGTGHAAAVVRWHLQRGRRSQVLRCIFLATFSTEGLIDEISIFFNDPRSVNEFFAEG